MHGRILQLLRRLETRLIVINIAENITGQCNNVEGSYKQCQSNDRYSTARSNCDTGTIYSGHEPTSLDLSENARPEDLTQSSVIEMG